MLIRINHKTRVETTANTVNNKQERNIFKWKSPSIKKESKVQPWTTLVEDSLMQPRPKSKQV